MSTILFLFFVEVFHWLSKFTDPQTQFLFPNVLSCFFLLLLLHFFEINFCSPWFTTNSRPIIPPRAILYCGLCTCTFVHWLLICAQNGNSVVVVLRSPIHANEPSEYNGMLYRTSNRVLNNGIKVIILICMYGTSQYHHHRKWSAAGLQIDLWKDLIKVQNSAIVALPGAFTTWWISNHWGYKHPTCAIPGETYAKSVLHIIVG